MGLHENIRYLLEKDNARDELSRQLIDRLVAVETRLAKLEGAPTVTVSGGVASSPAAGSVDEHVAKTPIKTAAKKATAS